MWLTSVKFLKSIVLIKRTDLDWRFGGINWKQTITSTQSQINSKCQLPNPKPHQQPIAGHTNNPTQVMVGPSNHLGLGH
jgi:hypothetical protein